ncbi:MmgE/PrpD family protein [Aeromicrobium wangtongii]|uniref:MmgE/PrpD family protein n=1 Tax=Aeromicrobium wangtongii TaxID=2969247 RepID=UPI0020178192|nr:MmgE/PrpD family protein [Aeromicrobium wangtongii]MCL3819616.1 MmgE/PrpD family protein [Aeromicrobium wangtongii]
MIARELATWGLGLTEVPDDVRRAALRHLLDGMGTAVGGIRAGSADPAVEVALGLGGPQEATILGQTSRVSAPAAALANGTLVHALDFDDTHAGGLVHATAVVLPAALAVGEQVQASGDDVLMAAVVGYETACRIAAAAPHGFHARGLHATMVAGVFSSAIIAARLGGLDVDRTTNALGIAGSQAGGLLAFLGTGASTKQLHPGFASQAGIIAARLAAAGATGPETVFDGPHGVFDALAQGVANPHGIVADLGERWETTRIGIKPYAACQLSHATLDAVQDARRQVEFGVDDIELITARVHPDSASVVCDTSRDLTRPASPYAAKFSLPWSVAALLADGTMTLETFDETSIARPELFDLAARVRVELAPSQQVAADARGEVRVQLRDGRQIVGTVERSAGGPDNPLSDADLHAKFTGNVGPGAAPLIAAIESLPDQPDLRHLMTVVAKTAADLSD